MPYNKTNEIKFYIITYNINVEKINNCFTRIAFTRIVKGHIMTTGSLINNLPAQTLTDQNALKIATEQLFISNDYDNNGTLNVSEFSTFEFALAKALGLEEPTDETLNNDFSSFDQNGDNELTLTEVQQGIESKHSSILDKETTTLILEELTLDRHEALMNMVNSSSNTSNSDDNDNYFFNKYFFDQVKEQMRIYSK